MDYFSARITVVCLVPGPVPEEGYTVDVQVHLYRARNFDDAFTHALEIGRAEENSYSNEFGETITWRFRDIEAITCLGPNPDGKEVSSKMEGWFPSETVDPVTDFDIGAREPVYSDER